MNRTDLTDAQRYTGGGSVGVISPGGQTVHTTNIFNEGVIGYAGLSLVGFSAFMFIKETLGLQKLLIKTHLDELKPVHYWNRARVYSSTQITPGGKCEAGVNT
jgi:hypothetical protein